MHAVLINQFYPPSTAPTGRLLSDLARELALRGHRVTVLTSAAAYGAERDSASDDETGPVRVLRLGAARTHRAAMAGKLADYLAFFRRARACLRRGLDPDVLVCMTTPPFCGLIGALQQRRHGTPYALWCMDLYPEAVAAHGLLSARNPIYRLLRGVAGYERRNAAWVIAMGPDMTERIQCDRSVRVEEVPAWSDLAALPETEAISREIRRRRGWDDHEVVLMYSGHMGRAHRADEFAALAMSMRERGLRGRVVMSGTGPRKSEWTRAWEGCVEFIPPAGRDEVAAHLLAADVHLVSQEEAWKGVVVPSKFQAACALGRPVLFAGPPDSSIGAWLADYDAGWIIPPGTQADIGPLVDAIQDPDIRSRKGRNARHLSGRLFSGSLNARRICDRLENL